MSQISDITTKVNSILKEKPLFYLSNDPERVLGLETLLHNFHNVHIDYSQYLSVFKEKGLPYFCLEESVGQNKTYRSSLKLLQNDAFKKYFDKYKSKDNFIQTFKISPAFEKLVQTMGANLLNTTGALNRLFEDKISQFNELKDLDINIPKTFVSVLNDTKFEDVKEKLTLPFVIQFNRGHTGQGTIVIDSEEQFKRVVKDYEQRPVKFSQFIEGTPYTINAVVGKTQTFMGGLSYQITGIPELTKFKGGTVGNDFAFRENITATVLNEIKNTVTTISNHMRSKDYLGLFGLDFIVKNESVYVIEINARQPASIPFYSQIQISQNVVPLSLIHLAEFLNVEHDIDEFEYNKKCLEPINFSQIFLRAEEKVKLSNVPSQGKYTYDEKKLSHINNDYEMNALNVNECVVLSPAAGHIVSTNGELARIQLPKQAMVADGNLNPDILNIFSNLKSLIN